MKNADAVAVALVAAGGPVATLIDGKLQRLTNGDCEAAPPYITGDAASVSNASAAVDATQKHAGSKSVKHTITATATASEARLCDGVLTTDLHELHAGCKYSLEGWAYVPSAGGPLATEVSLVLAYYLGAAWVETEKFPAGLDAFEKVTTGVIAFPSAAVAAKGLTRIAAAATDGELCYWDDMFLYQYDQNKLTPSERAFLSEYKTDLGAAATKRYRDLVLLGILEKVFMQRRILWHNIFISALCVADGVIDKMELDHDKLGLRARAKLTEIQKHVAAKSLTVKEADELMYILKSWFIKIKY